MTSIKEIEGIGSTYASQLAEAGVRTIEQLREVGATATGRMRLADEARLAEEQILQWTHQADLIRIKGIGEEFAELLVKAGVATVPKLAYRNAQNLYMDLTILNQRLKLVRRLPTVVELERMISQAKKLPKLIRH